LLDRFAARVSSRCFTASLARDPRHAAAEGGRSIVLARLKTSPAGEALALP
jgi:hypothetical protein